VKTVGSSATRSLRLRTWIISSASMNQPSAVSITESRASRVSTFGLALMSEQPRPGKSRRNTRL